MGDFAHYLVMVADLCQWCRSEGILTNTRGSAANSVVCYCLKIHQIDPIEYRLTFERFVNPERKKLPDIDLDIERDRYDDVIKFMQGYIEEREGSDQFAQIGNYGTLANRSTFRMVAESLGIEKETIDEVAKLLPQMIDSGLVDEEEDAYAALKEQYPEIYDLAAGVFDSIKNVSQHACGWAVGTKDRPLKQWVPLYLIASSGAFVTQYDYKTYEWFGLTKLDLLRLKTLSVVKRCLTMLGKDALDLQQIPLDDPETFAMMRAGKTDGVFTLQGKTNRQGVMEVEAQTVHDVIASVAIYRPSLTRPGYHRVYNARRRGEETVSYPSDAAERVLGESYGLPIFQEQILDLAKAIGFSDAESQDYLDAIKLAKGVGRGAKEAFDKLRDPFIQRATDNGLSDEEAEGTWDLVSSFQGYGFNRGHATSYGRLAVRAAYLKCHHPQEFFTSLLDVYPEVGRYVAAAKGDGFRILAPDANRSGVGFSRGEDAQSIRVGFTRIKGVGVTAARALVSGQPYASLDDLRSRTPSQAVNAKTIIILGEVGALKNFGIRASASESRQFELLSFLLEKPGALEGIEYRPKSRSTETWRFAGRTSGVEITEARTSVAKLFWIPEIENVLTLKASPWARVKSYLLTAVDENGIGFDIACQEDRAEEANYLKFIAKHCQGAAICMEGQIKQPFDRDRPMMFRFFDVAGTHQERPAVWGIDDKKVMTAFNVLHRRKMAARRSK
jgi:DNA polymerase-3 subunit alpha